MTTSRVTPAATSEDDRRLYRQWIEEEWWGLDGGLNDAIGIALGQKPILVSLPGEIPQYGFVVDPQTSLRFLEGTEAAKNAAKPQKSNVDAADQDKSVPVSRSDAAAEDDDRLFDPIDVEVPDGCEWDVPEQALGGIVIVRSREFVDWALKMRHPVPPVVEEGVRVSAPARNRPESDDSYSQTRFYPKFVSRKIGAGAMASGVDRRGTGVFVAADPDCIRVPLRAPLLRSRWPGQRGACRAPVSGQAGARLPGLCLLLVRDRHDLPGCPT